jgi:hypothetical protein
LGIPTEPLASSSQGSSITLQLGTPSITNRSLGGEGARAIGGGVLNIGLMTIADCTITNNQAVGCFERGEGESRVDVSRFTIGDLE